VSAILKWMFVLVLLVAVLGGGAAYWLYGWSDEGLRLEVLRQLTVKAPTLKFDIARAHFDVTTGRVRIYGLTAQLPGENRDQPPALEIPEIVVTLESTQLTDFENVVVQKLRVNKPKVRVVRNTDGTWNWQGIPLESTPGVVLPELEIEHGEIQFQFQLDNKPARNLKLQDFNLSAHPADSRRLAIQVATLLEPAGPLTLDVEVNLDGAAWKCASHEPWRVPVDPGLVQLLCDLSPEIATQVAQGGRWMDEAKTMQAVANSAPSVPVQLESRTQSSAIPDFGLRCVCNVAFQVQQDGPGSPLQFRTDTSIEGGKISNPLLPFPLQDLGGHIYIDNQQIVVSELQATSGTAKVRVEGDVIPNKPVRGGLTLRGVELNDALASRLPEVLRKILRPLALTGVCDVDLELIEERGKWQRQIDIHLTEGTVTHERFPVTVRAVAGNLQLKNDIVKFEAVGKYAGQPVNVRGTILNPGPAHEAEIVLNSRNLPFDDESLKACPAPVQKTIEALHLKGRHNLELRLTRAAGLGQKYEPRLSEEVHGGSLSFNGFPFEIQQLQGSVTWKDNIVEFTDLKGIHDGAKIRGRGRFHCLPAPGRLELAIEAEDAAFDRSLEMALPAHLRQVWNDFKPQGNFDMKTSIAWSPDLPCEIRIPLVKVRDCEVLMRSFPWPIHSMNGEFSYNTEPGKLVIKEVRARHDDTQLTASGSGFFLTGVPWQLKFTELSIEDLDPNGTFRNALPEALRRVFDILRPTGAYSFRGPVEFSASSIGSGSICAIWDLTAVLSRCAMMAGTPIDEISGVIQLKGGWDGTRADLDGELDLDSISVFRRTTGQAYQITGVRGPFSFHKGTLIAGTETAFPPRKIVAPDEKKRIRGEAIGGTVFLDAKVDLLAEPEYRVFVELVRGRLERYSQLYLRGQSNLAGVMNGYINLRGKGTSAERMEGAGKLLIAPAALYELPVFVQMFRMPQLQVPDRTAFEQAELNFTVGEGRFDFNSIELLGESMSLRGRGYIRLDGGMQLTFGSRPGRGPRRLIQNLFMGPEWVGVRVTGNVADPKTQIIPLPELDETMKQFLGVFDPRQMTPIPGRFAPRTGQNPGEKARTPDPVR
jgi:hypothetical protein